MDHYHSFNTLIDVFPFGLYQNTINSSFNIFNNIDANNTHYNIIFTEPINVIILSCGRWYELSKTIESFEKYNTYKFIRKKIVMDDCLDMDGLNHMQLKYSSHGYIFLHTTTPRNKNYSKTSARAAWSLYEGLTKYCNDSDVKYVFHLEDDWEFYRAGFIEDSLAILKSDEIDNNRLVYKNISQVHLRNYQIYKPRLAIEDFCGGSLTKDHIKLVHQSRYKGYHKNLSYFLYQEKSNRCWYHYSNNPGLTDVNLLIEGIENCVAKGLNGLTMAEHCLSCQYKRKGYTLASTMIMNGYVGHLGSKSHVYYGRERKPVLAEDKQIDTKEIKVINMTTGVRMNMSDCQYVL